MPNWTGMLVKSIPRFNCPGIQNSWHESFKEAGFSLASSCDYWLQAEEDVGGNHSLLQPEF